MGEEEEMEPLECPLEVVGVLFNPVGLMFVWRKFKSSADTVKMDMYRGGDPLLLFAAVLC